MGGWIKLCQTTDKEFPFKAREFERLYTRYVDQNPSCFPKLLKGIMQENNSRKGYLMCKPVLFGNSVSALKVYQEGVLLEHQSNLLILNQSEEHSS